MARARLFLLPDDHPAAIMLRTALKSSAWTWLTAVRKRMEVITGSSFSDICEHILFVGQIEAAKRCKVTRRQVLRDYRSFLL